MKQKNFGHINSLEKEEKEFNYDSTESESIENEIPNNKKLDLSILNESFITKKSSTFGEYSMNFHDNYFITEFSSIENISSVKLDFENH